LILFSALGCGGGRAFRLGFVGGLAHFLSSLYWLLAIPYTFHGIPIGPACRLVFLSAYCALFPALWVWLCWRIWPPPHPPHPQAFRRARRWTGFFPRASCGGAAGRLAVRVDLGGAGNGARAVVDRVSVEFFGRFAIQNAAADSNRVGDGRVWGFIPGGLDVGGPGDRAAVADAEAGARGVGRSGFAADVRGGAASFGANRVAKSSPAPERNCMRSRWCSRPFAADLIWNEAEDEARFNQMIALSEKALADNRCRPAC
jgi:hypothetical protein